MLYIAKTAHIQADVSIDCREIAELDATIKPWVLLVFDEEAPVSQSAWRLVGAFVAEGEALAFRRRVSRQITHRDPGPVSSLFPIAPLLERCMTGNRRQATPRAELPGSTIAGGAAREKPDATMAATEMDGA